VLVQGSGPAGPAVEAAMLARRRLRVWHDQLTRFAPDSDLSLANRDPRSTVPVSSMMTLFAEAALGAAELTGGLVDPTLVDEIERAGYASDHHGVAVPVAEALRLAPPRRAAAPHPDQRWRSVSVDAAARTLTRPPGVRLDSGGIAKGLCADLLATVLGAYSSFAVDAAGEIRFGGTAELPRPIQVASPFDDTVLHTFDLAHGALATSGITKRSWLDGQGRPAHHLLDPATGRPAFTGLVQVTALAPSALEAEARAKAALLSGARDAAAWLVHGGVIVHDDGEIEVLEP
jgi:thiamine biosynthesis lipoprotein